MVIDSRAKDCSTIVRATQTLTSIAHCIRTIHTLPETVLRNQNSTNQSLLKRLLKPLALVQLLDITTKKNAIPLLKINNFFPEYTNAIFCEFTGTDHYSVKFF